MKKFSLFIVLMIIISLVASCGTNKRVDKDLNLNNSNEDKIIIEKPKPEKAEKPPKEPLEEAPASETPVPEVPVVEVPASPELIKIDKKAYVRTNNLNVRDLGSLEGQVVSVLSNGTEVYVFGEKDNWYSIEYTKGKRGWVYSDYIQFEKASLPPEDEKNKPQEPTIEVPKVPTLKQIDKKAYITIDGLNVRALGSMEGKVISIINKGVEVYVFGEQDGWYFVEYAKDQRGWVYSNYVQFNPINQPPKDTASLSNKSYSWYFIRNDTHQQPGFDISYKDLLDKYNGITIGDKNKKNIFLTFDNGYENGYTVKILDILKRQNIKVGFFVQGTYIDKNPEIIRRMVKEGHIVLNHTNTHPPLPTLRTEKLQHEINIVAEKYKKVTGKEMLKFFRPPSGVFSERTLAETNNLGYRTVFWSMAYKDWVVDNQPGKEASYNHVIDNVHNGAVILLHSVSQSNTEALEDIIVELKKQGYSFKLLTEYP